MSNLPIIYDPASGMYVADSSLAGDSFNPIADVTLLNNLTAGSCVAIVDYTAQVVTSLYNHDYTGRAAPFVDGILLEDGMAGDTVKMANVKGYTYSSPYSLGFIGDALYLGKDGKPTTTIPTRLAGDLWYVIVGRRLNENMFLFDPNDPGDLTTGIIIPTPPPYFPDPTIDRIILAEAMPQLTAFAIGANGEAYTVTANNLTIPIIDGVTLESGGVGQEINIARLRNQWYTVTRYFPTQSMYWLTDSGGITDTQPTNTIWSVIVGRSSPNSNEFIFDPQLPIKLA